MKTYSMIVIGASAGGIEALRELFRLLRPNQFTSILIVVHIPAESKSTLPAILARVGDIPVQHATDQQPIRPGHAYIAPPNRHMLVQDGILHLEFGPKENGFRPAIDPLFRSAAAAFGEDVMGVVLSGNLRDGTQGLQAINRAGGLTVVQDPEEALFPGMPTSAISSVPVDKTLTIANIAALINAYADSMPSNLGGSMSDPQSKDYAQDEVAFIRRDMKDYQGGKRQNHRSVITCPDCGGVLWEMDDGKLVHFRCHVGHTYSANTLLGQQDEALEKAFWSAVRVLVEKAALSNRLALLAAKDNNPQLEQYYLGQARIAEDEAAMIRNTWLRGAARESFDISAGEQANQDVTQAHDGE